MSLAERVKSRREELGLTQTGAAEIAGITQQSWQAIEEGKTKKPRNLIGMAKALTCDPVWLAQGGAFKPVSELNVRRVPLISYVQAGALAENRPIKDIEGEFEYVMTDMDLSEHSFALRIVGDSMEPDFKEGDVIVVDPDVEPAPGEFVVAQNGSHEATFKKYRPLGIGEFGKSSFELIPLNSDYPKLDSTSQDIFIIGTMVEHRIYRRKR
ncbi:S24 family peptidase [Pectobacterium parmentieri]|uniref:S24 family peptidase n=1 Tax=Pectobacterium parmentieri TaxID=1905730 RepID=UPI0018E0E101|nr:LexA family transcriptional regulator [Pectobacterium parmentieri]QQA77035.1 helix-turn-helix domain-containing protein [Pectobacterium parmentieri]